MILPLKNSTWQRRISKHEILAEPSVDDVSGNVDSLMARLVSSDVYLFPVSFQFLSVSDYLFATDFVHSVISFMMPQPDFMKLFLA